MGDEQTGWRAHGERAIYDSPWVWLGQVDVELPDGQRIWHHVVRLRRAVAMLLLDEQDRVLMLWRHRGRADLDVRVAGRAASLPGRDVVAGHGLTAPGGPARVGHDQAGSGVK